jgi:hypothetical protein
MFANDEHGSHTMTRESIDHSMLRCTSGMSARALDSAQEANRVALFGKDGLQRAEPKMENEKENLMRRAAELRHLAEGGMCPRKYMREAIRLEAMAESM